MANKGVILHWPEYQKWDLTTGYPAISENTPPKKSYLMYSLNILLVFDYQSALKFNKKCIISGQVLRLECISSTSLPGTGCNSRSVFKWSKAGLNSASSLSETGCYTKAEKYSLPFYSTIAGNSCFLWRTLAQSKMKTSSRIWTQITHCISEVDNHYAKRASKKLM